MAFAKYLRTVQKLKPHISDGSMSRIPLYTGIFSRKITAKIASDLQLKIPVTLLRPGKSFSENGNEEHFKYTF